MIPTVIATTVMLALLGVLVVIVGLMPAPARDGAAPSLTSRALGRFRTGISRRTQLLLLGGVAAGVILFAISGWFITLIAVPAAVVGIPALLGRGRGPEQIARLEAIEQWARSLSGFTTSGASAGIEDSIRLSVRSVPDAIAEPVNLLAARIAARRPTVEALERFADDLDDSTGDLVAAHLILAVNHRGDGLTAALNDLAEDVFDDVKARRQIEADRAKVHQTVRFVTFVTLGLLLLLPFGNQFFSEYRTPFGQLLLTGWLVVYVLLLVRIRKRTQPTPLPRILATTERRI